MAAFYAGDGPLERPAELGRRDAELLLAHRKAAEAEKEREEREKREREEREKKEDESERNGKEKEDDGEKRQNKEEESDEGERESSEEAKRRYRRLVKGGSSGLEAFAAFNLGVLSGGCEAQLCETLFTCSSSTHVSSYSISYIYLI